MKSKFKWVSKIITLLVIAIIIFLIMLSFVGIPAPNRRDLTNVKTIVTGKLHSNLALEPQKIIRDPTIVSNLVANVSNSGCRIVLPTIGTIGGHAVFLDSEGNPIAAVFYRPEFEGLTFQNVVVSESGFRLKKPETIAGGLLQKVIRYNLFGDAKGKWKPIE